MIVPPETQIPLESLPIVVRHRYLAANRRAFVTGAALIESIADRLGVSLDDRADAFDQLLEAARVAISAYQVRLKAAQAAGQTFASTDDIDIRITRHMQALQAVYAVLNEFRASQQPLSDAVH